MFALYYLSDQKRNLLSLQKRIPKENAQNIMNKNVKIEI